MSDGPPDWIEEYYDGDVPSLLEDPSGPIAIEGLGGFGDADSDTTPEA